MSSKFIREFGFEWTETSLEEIQIPEKDADINIDFLLTEDNGGICVNGVYARQYPVVILRNNQPVFLVERSTDINKSSLNCDAMPDFAKSNSVVNHDTPGSLSNE